MKTTSVLIVATITLVLVLVPGWSAAGAPETPRLVLQITVDALRGDLPGRYAHLFGDGGFRYLMDQGVHYTNAHYQHANTETIVGHVSLATGAVPAAHGMVGNGWFDREDGRLVYNIEDPKVFITDFDGLTVASTHGSPWRYDTFVPVIFAGAGLAPERVARPVTPYDVAPTLANFLGVKPPSGAIGNPLVEVVDGNTCNERRRNNEQ